MGEGEPLILVHGLAASTLWWRRNIPALARQYRVYLLDLPGFGLMRRFYYRFVLDDMADWLLAWMDAMGIARVSLIGHSMGGYICLHIAAHHPEKVRRLILVAPAGLSYKKTMLGYFFPLTLAVHYAVPSFLPILFYDALRAGPLTFVSATRDLLRTDLRNTLKSITVPTLLIWGVNDMLVPAAFAGVFRQEIANSRLLLLNKAGHVVMYDQAYAFNNAVLAFLADQDTGM
ncbi:MAG TPA: alpha/beta fold hydrolase [Ktedonobacteraceae bacterium]|nr:alpha/beta fold hydrolase [Ktedonobacteraceae bacterium]